MHLYTKLLGLAAFVSYFGLDTLTTCIAVGLYGMGAESNPAMSLAMNSNGLAGFILLKIVLSLSLVMLSLILAGHPETRAIGESALVAILAGGALAAANNLQALTMGTSLFYLTFGTSYFGPGMVIALLMLLAGLTTYTLECLKDGKLSFRIQLR